MVLNHFSLKTSLDFDHYDLKSGIVFKGTTRLERINLVVFSTPNQNNWEREVTKRYHLSWILPILDFRTDATKQESQQENLWPQLQVWKRIRILGARSKNGCGKWNALIWNNPSGPSNFHLDCIARELGAKLDGLSSSFLDWLSIRGNLISTGNTFFFLRSMNILHPLCSVSHGCVQYGKRYLMFLGIKGLIQWLTRHTRIPAWYCICHFIFPQHCILLLF